jgi:hypothetical protein
MHNPLLLIQCRNLYKQNNQQPPTNVVTVSPNSTVRMIKLWLPHAPYFDRPWNGHSTRQRPNCLCKRPFTRRPRLRNNKFRSIYSPPSVDLECSQLHITPGNTRAPAEVALRGRPHGTKQNMDELYGGLLRTETVCGRIYILPFWMNASPLRFDVHFLQTEADCCKE